MFGGVFLVRLFGGGAFFMRVFRCACFGGVGCGCRLAVVGGSGDGCDVGGVVAVCRLSVAVDVQACCLFLMRYLFRGGIDIVFRTHDKPENHIFPYVYTAYYGYHYLMFPVVILK